MNIDVLNCNNTKRNVIYTLSCLRVFHTRENNLFLSAHAMVVLRLRYIIVVLVVHQSTLIQHLSEQ